MTRAEAHRHGQSLVPAWSPGFGVPGFGVYAHWPFCLAKCPYCDFNSHVRHQAIDEARYRSALLAELDWFAERSQGRTVRSVFFGGGTPSLMTPSTVAALIERIDALWGYEDHPEITLEANPTSVEADRFAGYSSAGVNRISLGVQALNDDDLARLGRRHSVDEALAALAIARNQFNRVSFDLIYARPGQTIADWQTELSRGLEFGCDHLSLYQLTIEPDTRFFDLHRMGKLVVPGEALAADLYDATQELCEAHDLPAYEISNHARPGAECRHNQIYWQGGAWAGIGPGAHARLGTGEARHALSTERNPERWLARVETEGCGIVEDLVLTAHEAADELLLMALRTRDGLDLDHHHALGGRIEPETFPALIDDGLLRLDPAANRIALTSTGRLVANAVITALAGPSPA